MRSSERSAGSGLAGRSRELEAFRSALRRVAAGSAAVVHVTGAIGIGRTRLLRAFAELAEAEGGVWLATRRGREGDTPLGRFLRAECSVPLPDFRRALDESAQHEDDLGHLLEAVARESRRAPLWLQMDDLHAADEDTRTFVERLVAAVHHGKLSNCRVGLVLNLLSDDALVRLLTDASGDNSLLLTETVGFKPAASREVLYAGTDHSSREATHMQVCEGLIGELGPEANEHCLTIAHHLIGAGSRADPTLVLHYAARAADVAFRHHSYYLAGRYYEAAARAGRDALPDPELAELHCRAGESFQRWSDGARSTACFREAVRVYERCDDLTGYARSLQGLLRNLVAFGDPSASGDTADEAATAAAALQGLLDSLPQEAVEIRVRVYDALAVYHHYATRYDVAETCARTAMSIARNSDEPALRCIPVTSLALAQMEQLRLTDARTTWLEGLSYDRAAGARHYEGLHLQRLPAPLYCLGEIREAAKYNQASYRHNEAIGNTGELCLNLTVDVMIANLAGRFDEAIGTAREALELMRTTRYLWSAPSLIGALAYALVMRRRFDEARAVLDHLSTDGLMFEDTRRFRSTAERLTELLQAHRQTGARQEPPARHEERKRELKGVRVGSLARLCGEAELALLQRAPARLGGVHDALEYVHRRGVALAPGWSCSVPRSLAVSTALRSGISRAAAAFDQASRLAERLDAPLEQGRVELYRGLATLACADGSPADAQPDLERALACFEAHDAPALADLARGALPRELALRE